MDVAGTHATVGAPRDWIAAGGRWAPLLDEWDGLPSYESDDGSLAVHELTVVQHAAGLERIAVVGGRGSRVGVAMPGRETMLPRGYGLVAARNMALDETSGLVPLHDEPHARWMWRPLLYGVLPDGRLQRFGSQNELAWRNGLMEAQRRTLARAEWIAHTAARLPDPLPEEDEWVAMIRGPLASWERSTPWAFVDADARAREILLEHLTWQQRLDFHATRRFYVRGHAHAMYAIQPGNGVAVVDAATREVRASLCIHPETWIPNDDVALAHKLLIESGPDGEQALLEAARRYPATWPASPATRADRYARDAERWLEQADA